MKQKQLISALSAGILTFLSSTISAELIDNGEGLIYDTVLDITWAQPDALRTWNDANDWAAGLTLGGVSGWRLPYISVAAGAGPFTGTPVPCNIASEVACRDNELGYMFYYNLSGTLGQPILDSGDPDLALFPSLQSGGYWSGTEVDSVRAVLLFFNFGNQNDSFKSLGYYSWAVHEGNVAGIADTDGDGVVDNVDNCILVPNGTLLPDAGGNSQLDTDDDGYGNICDPDFDNNETVDLADLEYLQSAFFGSDPLTDLDGDGKTDFSDMTILKSMLFGSPGPSGLAPEPLKSAGTGNIDTVSIDLRAGI